MITEEFKGINEFIVNVAKLLLKYSVQRITRGHKCFEFPYPVIFKINNPSDRLVTIPLRKWNIFLPYIESLWMATGKNDLVTVSTYLKKLRDFSDDGVYLRGGYGPRIRGFNGNRFDYKNLSSVLNRGQSGIDQFDFIEKIFLKDINTRQAIISISDPNKDCFCNDGSLIESKDIPCTKCIHFLNNGGQLDLIVYMRSNDYLWGATGVDIFNFTFIQEYFSSILGLKLGDYYHIVSNFHYYGVFSDKVEELSRIEPFNNDFIYSTTFESLEDFDTKLSLLNSWEESIRKGNLEQIDLNDDFFNDWASVLGLFHGIKSEKIINPILHKILIQRGFCGK